jgi:uncharacterized protein
MVDVSVAPFEIETISRHGDLIRADVYLPKGVKGPFPVLLGASPYQKALRRLPAVPQFAFIEYGPMQLYLDEGYAYVAMDTPGTGRSDGIWDPVSRTEGEAIHDMIEHVAALDWSTGKIGMIGMSHVTDVGAPWWTSGRLGGGLHKTSAFGRQSDRKTLTR